MKTITKTKRIMASFYENDLSKRKQLVLEALGNPKCAHLTIYRQRPNEENIVRVTLTQKDMKQDSYQLEWNQDKQIFIDIQKANII